MLRSTGGKQQGTYFLGDACTTLLRLHSSTALPVLQARWWCWWILSPGSCKGGGSRMGALLGARHQKGGGGAGGGGVSTRWVCLLCISCFCLGTIVVNRLCVVSERVAVNEALDSQNIQKYSQPNVNCEEKDPVDILTQVSQTHDIIITLDKTISSLEMQLAAARASQGWNWERSPTVLNDAMDKPKQRKKVFFVMGIITAFSSRRRRDSIRQTWMPQGNMLKKLEKEKGIIMRFVIGNSSTPGGVLDRAVDAEEEQHQDFLRLNHVEGYHELSTKTQIYFSTAVEKWDADFYVKVDDDVHVNPGMISSTLARHRSKPRVYIGCMKSGLVLVQQGVKYHEPEYWKFGEAGNKYFRHATGQIYAISKDLATYISVNRPILHRYANEDVSLGSWFIGLDVEHIDDRSLCCGTPPDCEWKAQAGNPCGASFDWSCSGVCKSVERMDEVHRRCAEEDDAVWHAMF